MVIKGLFFLPTEEHLHTLTCSGGDCGNVYTHTCAQTHTLVLDCFISEKQAFTTWPFPNGSLTIYVSACMCNAMQGQRRQQICQTGGGN